MYLLDNYDFLEPLVKDGLEDTSTPFFKDGLALANKPINPNHVFVFHFQDGYCWITYAWTDKKNKSFYKFVKELEQIIFKFEMPILRMGANEDIKNHTRYVGTLNNHKIYEYIKR